MATAYKDPFEEPSETDDEDVDLAHSYGMHEEFISEIGEVLDLPEVDVDGYVGPDGKPQPHETPLDVAHEADVAADLQAEKEL